ncbi:MAG TPA: hypothetical protein VM425_21435 [Myxococcota bacterium]|nr:hypothetical protein [Myxococcota bacterium]
MSDVQKNTPASGEDSFFESEVAERDPQGLGQLEERKLRSRRLRARIFVCLVLALALVLIYMLRDDLAYFFESRTPVDFGLAEEMQTRPLDHNSYVHLHGIARDMCIKADLLTGSVRFLYLLGSDLGSRILIETPTEKDTGCLGAVESDFEGRLVNLDETRRYDRVLSYYRKHFPSAPRERPVYLLQDGMRPLSAWWYPLAVLVILLLWVLNVRTLIRIRRRARLSDQGGTQ